MTEEGPNRELLEAVHEFPGSYTLKAFGPHEQGFVDAIAEAAKSVHAGASPLELGARSSSKGNHVCVTATVWVDSADDVYAFYAAVRRVGGLRMVL